MSPPPKRRRAVRHLPADVEAACAARWQAGEQVDAITEALGVDRWRIYHVMQVRGVPRPKRKATLAGEDATLRALFAEGHTQQAIARHYGVSIGLVNLRLHELGLYRRGREAG